MLGRRSNNRNRSKCSKKRCYRNSDENGFTELNQNCTGERKRLRLNDGSGSGRWAGKGKQQGA